MTVVVVVHLYILDCLNKDTCMQVGLVGFGLNQKCEFDYFVFPISVQFDTFFVFPFNWGDKDRHRMYCSFCRAQPKPKLH